MHKKNGKFLKNISNLIVYVVTLLGIFAILSDKVNPDLILISTSIVLFAGFVFLVIYHISQLENKIENIEKKFIREQELRDIKSNIKALKIIVSKNE